MYPILKFECNYIKFPAGLFTGDEVRLVEVFKTRFEDLHNEFILYDTLENNRTQYELPQTGDALVLLLLFGVDLFTTIRMHTPELEELYLSTRGDNITVEIEEK